MNATLYTTEILRLAASLPDWHPMQAPSGASELRSPTCGSRIRLEVAEDAQLRVEGVALQIHACAFGQASAALVARHAPGRTLADIEAALDETERWLAGERDEPSWPGLEALAPARPKKARHGAILLPFRALAAAMAEPEK